ncbi:MAG: amino acid ABC transporter substrate-binding protein [Chloroflexia bacterium]|nr:amino acid ABC transporter substrate-binding protein [Chloroflexia bacterium]
MPPHRPWLRPLLWSLLLLNLTAGLLLPPWLADESRRRITAGGALRVGLDPAYPPFENDVQGQFVGYDVDLALALGEALELEIVFVPMGYDGLYDALISGQIDAILSSYPYSPELCRWQRCTRPYFQAGQVLVVPLDSPISGPEDLDGRRVGVEWGGPADALVRPWEENGQIAARVLFMSPQEALEALAAGQVDAVVVDRISALMTTADQPQLRILPQALQDESFVIVVARSSVWLHHRLQRALGQLEREGLLETLQAHWCRPHSP